MKIFLLFLLLLFSPSAFCQVISTVTGKVVDKETQNPVYGAAIMIINEGYNTSRYTSISNNTGTFEIKDLPYGTYSIEIISVGYERMVKTDIVILSSRPTEVNIELTPTTYITETINVEAKYFDKPTDANSSIFNLDFEEVRRAPGAVEDISRMVQVLPGVAPGNDQRNDLIVRGGSPAENMVLIDGIEIPNVNHFPSQGATGGPIGMINVKFIEDVNFFTGGFSSRYGDKLSSVMEIKFREGSRKSFLSDINISSAGFGAVLEGPLLSKKGSLLFSFRRSYLNLIKGAIRLAAVPNYWDFNLKAKYDINKNNIIVADAVAGIDDIQFEGDESKVSDDNPFGKVIGRQRQLTAGINWKSLIQKGYLQTILSNSTSDYFYRNNDIKTGELIFDNDSRESEYSIRSELYYQLNRTNNLIFGGGAKYIQFRNRMYIWADTTGFGETLPPLNVNSNTHFYKLSAFMQYTLKLLNNKININTGIRFDYFSGIENKNAVNPRLGLTFNINKITALNFSGGIYSQSPNYLWISGDPSNYKLKYMKTYQFVAGIQHLLKEDLKLSVEAYYKKYNDYPVSVLIPTFVLVNGGADYGPNIIGEAVSEGRGYVRGVDVSIHKKLTGSGLYGMINYSLSESRFTALKGGEKPGSFDYTHNLTIIAGYQISNDWLAGLKFRYTTGRPYTPIDVQASTAAGREVYFVNQYNEARYKDYLRLDIRVDKKWNLHKWSIVSYLELQNVTNRVNVYQYFWNRYKNQQGTIYQWEFLPVGGLSVQF